MADTNIPPNPHAEGAKALLAKIRALRAEVPRFLEEAPLEERRRVISVASIRPEALESASVVVEQSERLKALTGADPARLRDANAYSLAYDAIVNELQAFAGAVEHSIRVYRAEAGYVALDVLAVARRLSKRKDGGSLLPHVEAIQRHVRRGRRPRKPAAAPAPTPEPETPDTERKQ